jgi:ribosomal protein S20
LLIVAESKIARAKGKGLLHANTAARKISLLAKKVAAASRTA